MNQKRIDKVNVAIINVSLLDIGSFAPDDQSNEAL